MRSMRVVASLALSCVCVLKGAVTNLEGYLFGRGAAHTPML